MFTRIILFLKSFFKTDGFYPYNDSLKDIFPKSFTPLVSLDYIRELMYVTSKTMTEIETLLMIVIQEEPVSFGDVADNIYHVSDEHVARVLRNLKRSGYLDVSPCGNYTASIKALEEIKKVDRKPF